MRTREARNRQCLFVVVRPRWFIKSLLLVKLFPESGIWEPHPARPRALSPNPSESIDHRSPHIPSLLSASVLFLFVRFFFRFRRSQSSSCHPAPLCVVYKLQLTDARGGVPCNHAGGPRSEVSRLACGAGGGRGGRQFGCTQYAHSGRAHQRLSIIHACQRTPHTDVPFAQSAANDTEVDQRASHVAAPRNSHCPREVSRA